MLCVVRRYRNWKVTSDPTHLEVKVNFFETSQVWHPIIQKITLTLNKDMAFTLA